MNIKIIGTGSYLPEKIVTNKDLEKTIETTDEWIKERTGIAARHVAAEDETVASLATKASLRAIESAGISADEIDLVLVATCSHKEHVPSASCLVQEAIGAKNAAAFDIGAACTGFLTALSVASAYLETGMFSKILVVGSELLSGIVDWNDRTTCILFGDGAGAAIVTRGETSESPVFCLGADGSGANALRCHVESKLSMDGQAVYRFATRTVPMVLNKTLEKANKTVDDINLFILHQANSRIIASIVKSMGAQAEKFPINLTNNGNISSASIPVLLDEQVRCGNIKKGDLIALSGFGAGLTYGACILRWE